MSLFSDIFDQMGDIFEIPGKLFGSLFGSLFGWLKKDFWMVIIVIVAILLVVKLL